MLNAYLSVELFSEKYNTSHLLDFCHILSYNPDKERRQAASAFFQGYMGFRWSAVQIGPPRPYKVQNPLITIKKVILPHSIQFKLRPLYQLILQHGVQVDEIGAKPGYPDYQIAVFFRMLLSVT